MLSEALSACTIIVRGMCLAMEEEQGVDEEHVGNVEQHVEHDVVAQHVVEQHIEQHMLQAQAPPPVLAGGAMHEGEGDAEESTSKKSFCASLLPLCPSSRLSLSGVGAIHR